MKEELKKEKGDADSWYLFTSMTFCNEKALLETGEGPKTAQPPQLWDFLL